MIKLKNIEAKVNDDILFQVDNFTFYDGSKYILTGENGSGKSTLLKSFVNLTSLVDGEIFSDKDIVYQPQSAYIFRNNVADNFKIIGIDPKAIRNELEFFNIDKLLNQNIDKLSGGEKEKVIFLRSILNANQTLILDEPFSQMDKKSSKKANIFLDEWLSKSKDRMVILTSHGSLSDLTYDYHVNIDKKKLIIL